MKRFFIIFLTELKAWLRDPITVLGGFIPSLFMLCAFGLLFGGKLSLSIGLINHDKGQYGIILEETLQDTLSPLGNNPYYDLKTLPEEEIWQAYETYEIDGVWIIPEDFSERIIDQNHPKIEMHFSNYIDDRAKNHRIYAAEIMWHFYTKIDYPHPPIDIAESYPLPSYIDWFPIISTGIALMSMMIGSMINIFMLTHKEQVAKINLEFGLTPRSLLWIFIPKVLLAVLMGLLTGTVILGIIYIWIGTWPGRYLPWVWFLGSLVALFWAAISLQFGLRTRRYMSGVIGTILTGITAFFITGGLNMIRGNEDKMLLISWFFPNTYAIDPLRDLALFSTLPENFVKTILILVSFAGISLVVGFILAGRNLRKIG